MWPNLQETADLVTFTEKILNGKLHFLCRDNLSLSQTIRTSEQILVISKFSNELQKHSNLIITSDVSTFLEEKQNKLYLMILDERNLQSKTVGQK